MAATKEQLAISRKPQGKPRRYICGAHLVGENMMPFVVRSNPPVASLASEVMTGTAEEAHVLAASIVERLRSEVPAEVEHTVVDGSVAQHTDEDATHFAIVLRCGAGEHDALFLTSSERWARTNRSRRATKDEIAFCGFAVTATTYVVLVRRFAHNFTATGLVFPEHRLKALVKEFL